MQVRILENSSNFRQTLQEKRRCVVEAEEEDKLVEAEDEKLVEAEAEEETSLEAEAVEDKLVNAGVKLVEPPSRGLP